MDVAGTARTTPLRNCRRQLRNLVGAAVALQPGRTARDAAPILARQACQALAARQAVASVTGADGGGVAPFRAFAGETRVLSDDHARLLERAESGEGAGIESMVDPATRAVVAVAAPINDRHGRPVGALLAADGYAGTFGEDDIAVLVGLASMASLTIETDRRHESERPGEARPGEAVRQAAGNLAYELVDLLTVIAGHAALLEVTLAESDDRRQDAAAIALAVRRASRVAEEIRALSCDA